MLLKKLVSYLLIAMIAFSPMQSLIAKTNQSLAAQHDMSSMMDDGSMSIDCEHCQFDGKLMMNCFFPSISIDALGLTSKSSRATQTSTRLSHNSLVPHIFFTYTDLFTKPPISSL